MRVIVIGAGVIGTTSAWYLAADGHQVTVLERRPGPAEETSRANGGQISASHTEPWASPANLIQAIGWLGRRDAPLVLPWWKPDPELWGWLLGFLRNCTPGRAQANQARALRLAVHSRVCLGALRDQLDLDYEQARPGILNLYRTPQGWTRARRAVPAMRANGLAVEPLEAAAIKAREPALAHLGDLAGGLLSPDDETGDAHLFTRALATHAAQAGVGFRFDCPVRGLLVEGGGRRVIGVETTDGPWRADAVVLAAGSFSAPLAGKAGLELPIYPAKGYSLTVDTSATPAEYLPRHSLIDHHTRMVYARLGDRLRAAGTAELTGYGDDVDPGRWAVVRDHARALLPHAGDYAEAQPWAGLRPATPDSCPIIGPAPLPGLWLNSGHGTLGWTMAAGSGQLLADLMAGRAPAIEAADLGLNRGRS
ncbi:D-amino acid dehydrogenase [Roseospirillum parvum]|uniref:D-amino-acid dehydrogenase n=1 Tax=Roseospirillum parvum TaxID=83401 RepID=A0A1G7YGL2_9PROT|nr:D-amino acid dehydrogenase [Roseospirillum parvum]SDG95732.1 D-amino-acid dehydrogenase [Roseospirillum parvum]